MKILQSLKALVALIVLGPLMLIATVLIIVYFISGEKTSTAIARKIGAIFDYLKRSFSFKFKAHGLDIEEEK